MLAHALDVEGGNPDEEVPSRWREHGEEATSITAAGLAINQPSLGEPINLMGEPAA
jgi:hypothetical protein